MRIRRAFTLGIVVASAIGARTAASLEQGRRLTQYDDRAWGVRDGLPQANVHAVAQTPDGYLWIGTDGGLARFDGRSFTVFDSTNTPALRVHRVRALLVDREGSLWIGTDAGAGLIRYRQGRFETFEERTGLRGAAVISMLQERDGDLWFGGYRGAMRLSGERFTRLEQIDGHPVGPVYAFAEAAGVIWIGGASGVLRVEGERATRLKKADGVALQPVWSMLPDPDGAIWLATSRSGLVHFDGIHAAVARDGETPAAGLLRDRDGTLWVAGQRGLGRVRGAAVEWAARGTSLAEPARALAEDREGNLWVGREAAGLLRLTQGTFTSLPPEMFEGRTLATFAGRDGALWVASAGVGVLRIEADAVRVFRSGPAGPCTPNVWAIAEDAGGGLWLGGTAGPGGNFCRLDPARGTVRSYGTGDGLPITDVRSILPLSDGERLVGTGTGLFRMRGDRLEQILGPGGRPLWNVLALHRDVAGTVWVAASGGLLGWAPDGRWTRFGPADGLSNGQVFSIDEDRHGTLWLGTLSGFTRLEAGRLTAWRHRQGFVDDPVFKVLIDGTDDLWLCSSKGVFRVTAKSLAAFDGGPGRRLEYTHYDSTDGLKADQCEGGFGQAAGARTQDGRLWFGTARGVSFVDPRRPARVPVVPAALVESVRFDDRAWPEPPRAGERLRLPPGRGDLQIAFTAFWLARPEKLRFRYRLDPFDRAWVEAADRRVAYYTKVPPGSYRFRVVAATDERESAQPPLAEAALALSLAPHWHQVGWVRAAAVMMVAAALAGLGWLWHRRRLRALEAQQVAVLAERSRIARDLHDTLAHGFTGIAVQLEVVAKRLPDLGGVEREHLDQARALVRASLAEARRAVWDLRPAVAERNDLVGALSEIARNLSADVPVRVQLNGQPRPLPAAFEAALVRIGQEALTNALRHARAANIALEISFVDEAVHLRISDDGRGFDAGEPVSEAGHAGLDGIRARARSLNAELQIASEPGAGTEILLAAPLPRGEPGS